MPLVNTAEEAARAVAAYYSPIGMRSVGPVRGLLYGGGDYVAHANDEIIVMAMIRPRRAWPIWSDLRHPGLTRSISGRRICRWLWAWRRAPTIPTRCTWRPATRSATPPTPRHQGGDALRRRRFAAGAVKRFDMVMLTDGLSDGRRAPAAGGVPKPDRLSAAGGGAARGGPGRWSQERSKTRMQAGNAASAAATVRGDGHRRLCRHRSKPEVIQYLPGGVDRAVQASQVTAR